MKKIVLSIAMIVAFTVALVAQEKPAFTPSGKASAKLFTNIHTDITDGDALSAFELTRAYFGYEYQMTETFSGKVLLDVGDPGVGSLEMTAFAKNALLQYKENGLTVQFGLVGTKQFSIQEKSWGYRYISKSFQDEYKFGASADLGITAAYKFSEMISADVSILNGEGYKKVQGDSIFKYGVGVTVLPVDGLTLRVYADMMGDTVDQQNIAAFIGYAADDFSVGAEYNTLLNNKYNDGADLTGLSVYATYHLSDNMGVFGRYDQLSSKDDWNLSKDGDKIIAGFEYAAAKGVNISPNVQLWTPADDSKENVVSAYINLEIKF